jgi:hypothetical protein
MNRVCFFGSLIVLCTSLITYGQDGWELREQKDNIKVYSRIKGQSKIEELKAEFALNAKLSDLAAFLLDIPNYLNWSYNTKLSYIVKQISPNELYFYKEVKLPWPMINRDLIVHLKILQDSSSKVMTIRGVSVPDFIPPKKDIVRIHFSNESWTVIPKNKNRLQITYYLEIDPGETAPAWMVNLFSTKGSLESFRSLSGQVKAPKYEHASIGFIKN